MDIRPAYSCLLGRPWIHGVGAVPFSLHQKVKFIADRQLVSVMGERELVISTHALELTPGSNAESLAPSSAVEEMAFRVMIKEGYQSGKGLGPLLKGIPAPIKIQENKGRARLGYQTGNQGRNGQALPAQTTWGQHFVRESVAMIGSQSEDRYGKVYASDEQLANWTAESLADEFLFAIPIKEPAEDEDAETEALAEVERQIEQERPKFQPLTKELENVNLGDKRDRKEIRIGN
ncbi:hypothetical protein CR513_36672, partial [Mucuna pruriens]